LGKGQGTGNGKNLLDFEKSFYPLVLVDEDDIWPFLAYFFHLPERDSPTRFFTSDFSGRSTAHATYLGSGERLFVFGFLVLN
jgi:hypothetical protein